MKQSTHNTPCFITQAKCFFILHMRAGFEWWACSVKMCISSNFRACYCSQSQETGGVCPCTQDRHTHTHIHTERQRETRELATVLVSPPKKRKRARKPLIATHRDSYHIWDFCFCLFLFPVDVNDVQSWVKADFLWAKKGTKQQQSSPGEKEKTLIRMKNTAWKAQTMAALVL